MLRFALKTLVSDRSKMLTGLAGVVFSLVLVNVQGGLYLGLMSKASVLVDHCDADLWVGQQMVENVDLARDIPELWMNRLRGIPGVSGVRPYIVGKGTAALDDGRMEDVWVIGSEPGTMLGSGWKFASGSRADLRHPDSLSFDTVDIDKLGNPRIGQWIEVNGHHMELAAQTDGITGFITMPYLFTTFETARRISHIPDGACSFLLVQLDPDADADRVRSMVERRVPDAAVYTPAEFARISQDYWMKRTGIGVSFGASTALGLLVGLMVVGQSLYALALDHRDDYATLKALGAGERQICSVILLQSLAIGGAGAVLGMLIVAAIARHWHSPLAPVEIPWTLAAGSVGVAFVICIAAALLPYVRIRRIDPATVLMG